MRQVIFNQEHPNGLVQELDEITITAEDKILQLKAMLSVTDYQAIKYAEGQMTEEEYAPIKAERQKWRDEINALEKKDVNTHV